MGGTPGSKPYLRFACGSLAAVLVISGTFAVLAMRLVASHHESGFARSVASTVGAPLSKIFDDADLSEDLPRDLRARADLIALPLIAGQVRDVRVLSAGGVYYDAGGDAPAGDPRGMGGAALSHARARSVDGAASFVTYINRGDYLIEVSHDPSPLNSGIGSARLLMLLVLVGFTVTAYGLTQAAFWFGIRTLTMEHGRLTYLYDTGQQLRSSLDLHDVLTQLTADATTLAHAHYGMVALFDQDNSEVVLRATFDAASGNISLHQRALDEWFIRRCVATNTTVTSTSAAGGYRQYFGKDAEFDRTAALLCVPMAVRERVVGAIAVIRQDGSFNQMETHLVEQLAAQAVTAIEQAILFAKVRSDATEIESSYDATLKALMAALDAKDEVTEGHCERVAKLTVQLAKTMSVPASMLVHIERGALLHDVGKIGVPDGVLKKPRALNDQEWEAMRKHPLLAGLMVSKVGFLEPALPILLYHHERWDGTGYPFGLAEENIPVEARIFSVIDAYDAMTSDRPYRPAMSHREAMAEVRINAARQFDPEVVIAFERLMAARPELREHTGRHVLSNHDDDLDPALHNDEQVA